MKLLVATRNPGKASEIRELFHGLPFDLVFPADLALARLPEEAELERAATYAANAVAKARYFAERSGLPTCADDSGLEVDALGGAPGVYSAHFAELAGRRPEGAGGAGGAGEDVDRANNALLLEKLAGVPDERRTARYRCVVAYLHTPTAAPELVEATCEGRILWEPRGSGGFGYDPLFFSTDLGMSFGEAAPAAKHRVSHRGRAFRALIEVLLRRRAEV
ncbi:MAG TPA: non-canonical purine NTP pyrophosphatase [Gemmatimonadales bacterium]|nr:non-canonical purine NTP pyrophosphatase [Gemmatimonadales bacterium]